MHRKWNLYFIPSRVQFVLAAALVVIAAYLYVASPGWLGWYGVAMWVQAATLALVFLFLGGLARAIEDEAS